MSLVAAFQKVWISAVILADICCIRRRDDHPLGSCDGDAEEPLRTAPCICEDLRGLPLELICWNLPGRAIFDELTEPGSACHQRHSFLLLMNVGLQECLAIRYGKCEALIDFVAHNATGKGF